MPTGKSIISSSFTSMVPSLVSNSIQSTPPLPAYVHLNTSKGPFNSRRTQLMRNIDPSLAPIDLLSVFKLNLWPSPRCSSNIQFRNLRLHFPPGLVGKDHLFPEMSSSLRHCSWSISILGP